MSLKTRMAMVAGLAVALAVVVVAVASYEGTKSSLLDSVDQALAEQAKPFMERGVDRGGPPRGPNGPPGFTGQGAPPPRFGEPAGNVQVITPAGQVIRPPDETAGPPVDARARQIAAIGVGHSYSDATVSGTHVRVLTQGIGGRGAVQVARSLQEVDNVLSDQLLLLILVGAGGIILAAVLSIVVARTALRPITLFTRRTESLTANPDPSQRLEVSGRDEIARLAHSFNTTLDALEQSVEAQRNLVADASHELRTPIATLRANIQLLRDADRLSPAEQRSLRDDIITELDVVQRTRRRATDVAFDVELEPTLIEGEPERVGRAVTNLLDNARRWSPSGGTVSVHLADGVLSVRDHGPGFDEDDLPHVFDRFYRAQRARGQPGSGLGLAIVRQAAEAHGGWARAANADGGGALLRVSFGQRTSELTPGEVGASLS
jgi:two-component system sensor histidine kinase MprB